MKKLSLLLFTLLFTASASADLKKDGEKLCTKIKSCASIAIDQQAISPDEKVAILGVIDSQCLSSVQKYEKDLGSAGLEGKAKACLTSLSSLSCDSLMNGSGPLTTTVCTDFENSAKAAGINLGQ